MRLASLSPHAAPVQIHSSGGVSSPVGKAWLDANLRELMAKSEGTVTDDTLASTSDFVFVKMLQKLFSTTKNGHTDILKCRTDSGYLGSDYVEPFF